MRDSIMHSKVMLEAKTIWDYFASFSEARPCDAIVVCCSYDLRVCDYACALAEQLRTERIVFSGKTGNWTHHLWDETEAHVFKRRALSNGICPDRILLEEDATNLGENVAYSRKLLPDAQTITFVTKPNTILRVKLTTPIHWPAITAYTACPENAFPDDVSHIVGVFGVINEMVGDIQRIIEYPHLGYQRSCKLPAAVILAYEYLVERGFTQHLMR